MTEPQQRPERIDLAEADDLRDVVHRAVASLAQGGVVGFPTESGYALAACALYPKAIARLQSFETAEKAPHLTVLLRSAQEVRDWIPALTQVGSRITRRAWPGPVSLIFPIQPGHGLVSRLPREVQLALIDDGTISLRVPSNGLLRDAMRLSPGPIVVRDLWGNDGRGLGTSSQSEVEGLDLIIDQARRPDDGLPTVVAIEHESYRIVQSGVIPDGTIAEMAGAIWLFVCTGNTCRSPMAEAICKVLLAKRLGCPIGKLVERGYVIGSAGVFATDGMPAASHAIDIIGSRGGSLKHHESRRATDSLIRKADLLIALAGEHLDVLLDIAPDAADRARLLHPHGLDILDPIGSDRTNYQQTANEIEAHITRLLDDMGL